MASFLSDVSYMGPLKGIVTGARDKWARVLAIVHESVPCKEEMVAPPAKCAVVPITIVRILDAGFSSAPYTAAKKGSAPPPQTGPKPDPLFRLDNSKNTPVLDTWSYVSKGMNRGPRESGPTVEGGEANPPMFALGTGTTFVWFVNPMTFQTSGATGILPDDAKDNEIPAMSLVELLIAPRHVDSCVNGRCINIKSMRLSTTEIDAVFQRGIDAVGMPSSAEASIRNADMLREKYPSLQKDLEMEKTSFVVPGKMLISAFMDPDEKKDNVVKAEPGSTDDIPVSTAVSVKKVPRFTKLILGGASVAFPGCEYIDIPDDMLCKQTNTTSHEHAKSILDIALAMGAVNLWVLSDPRWANRADSSCYRAIPVIDTTILFGSFDLVRSLTTECAMVAKMEGGEIVKLPDGSEDLQMIDLIDDPRDPDAGDGTMLVLSTGVPYDEGVLELMVKVTEVDSAETVPKATMPPSNFALALVGPKVMTTKGYAFEFGVKAVDGTGTDTPRIFCGHVNRAVGSAGATGIISRKRKALSMD
jgi:hypothetical protein